MKEQENFSITLRNPSKQKSASVTFCHRVATRRVVAMTEEKNGASKKVLYQMESDLALKRMLFPGKSLTHSPKDPFPKATKEKKVYFKDTRDVLVMAPPVVDAAERDRGVPAQDKEMNEVETVMHQKDEVTSPCQKKEVLSEVKPLQKISTSVRAEDTPCQGVDSVQKEKKVCFKDIADESDYEKMIQRNRERSKAFLDSLGLDEVKQSFCQSVLDLMPKKRKYTKKEKNRTDLRKSLRLAVKRGEVQGEEITEVKNWVPQEPYEVHQKRRSGKGRQVNPWTLCKLESELALKRKLFPGRVLAHSAKHKKLPVAPSTGDLRVCLQRLPFQLLSNYFSILAQA